MHYRKTSRGGLCGRGLHAPWWLFWAPAIKAGIEQSPWPYLPGVKCVCVCVFQPGFPSLDKSKVRPHANIWIYLLGDRLMWLCATDTHFLATRPFWFGAIDLFAHEPKMLNGNFNSGFRSRGVFYWTTACTFCFLPSVRAPLKYGKLSCIICNEQNKICKKIICSFSSSALSMRHSPNSVCPVLRISSCSPAVAVFLCFASKHCKVQEGLKKTGCKVIREKDHLLLPAEECVPAFRGCWKHSCSFVHTHGHLIRLSSM